MSARTADAVTLGDTWLGPAIKAGYLQPLQDVDSYRWWVSLQPRPCLALSLPLSPTPGPGINRLYRNAQDITVERQGFPCT